MYYLLLGLNRTILNISEESPVLTEEGNLKIWKFGDGSGIMNQGYSCIGVDMIPDGMIPNKYCYREGEFVPNPNYQEPVVTVQQYIDLYQENKKLRETVEGQLDRSAESELELDYRLSLVELGLI